MKRNLLINATICLLAAWGMNAFAQTEVNSLDELASIADGTEVKVNLNNVHTSASNYDYWAGGTMLYMQDETAGVAFKGMTDIVGGKTLNGSITAVAKKDNGIMGLSVSSATTTDNVAQAEWDYSGTPVITIGDIENGGYAYMLVTLMHVTSGEASSSYAVSLSDGTNTIDLYNDWDLIRLSDVPENIESVTALVMPDAWNGGYYLIPIRQDLIKEEGAPEDAKAVKSLDKLADISDGEVVLVTLNNVRTTAVMGDGVVMEDATAGTVFYGIDMTERKVMNGEIYATAKKVGNDICLTVNEEKTNMDNVTVTESSFKGSPIYLNGARSSYWHNRLVVLSDLQVLYEDCIDGDGWMLVQGDIGMEMKDLLHKLDGFLVPEWLKSLTGVVLYNAVSDSYVIAPTDRNLIIEGEAPVEPQGIAAVKLLADGTDFELTLEDAQVTYVEEDTNGVMYIVEDAFGGLMLQDFPYMGWEPGQRLTGKVYGRLTRERADEYYTDVAAVATDATDMTDVVVKEGVLTPTVLTCEEALTSRYYSCYVKIENMWKGSGTMSFMGYDYDYTAVEDATGKILFDDGWCVLPEEWQDFYEICQLPDDTKSVAGTIEPMFNCTFIYPLSMSDVVTASGIKTIDANANANANIYNIAGQRIEKMQKGINIVNGKKIILK